MSDFIVSARKYRPATFRSVVGQKHITSTLQNAIERGQLAHAYLFCGPRGVGKTTCARIFAKAINCLAPDGAEACNECESCRSFNEGRSLNIHELDAASNNSVEDIRTLIEQVRIIPQVGRYSVFIIDEVHMLSAAAFNAFLKTLEEPPAHAIFILATTEKHKIIPTILSRCQIYDFNRIRVEDSVEYLKYIASQEGISADEESLNLIRERRPRFVPAFELMRVQGNTISLSVPTSELREEILRSKTGMLMRIAELAGITGAIELEVVVNEEIRAARPIKLEDRVKYMTEKNPLIAELRKALDLEVE